MPSAERRRHHHHRCDHPSVLWILVAHIYRTRGFQHLNITHGFFGSHVLKVQNHSDPTWALAHCDFSAVQIGSSLNSAANSSAEARHAQLCACWSLSLVHRWRHPSLETAKIARMQGGYVWLRTEGGTKLGKAGPGSDPGHGRNRQASPEVGSDAAELSAHGHQWTTTIIP